MQQKNQVTQQRISTTLQELKGKGYIYEKDGATWFKSTEFKDDKEANEILELVRYANVHNQKPIVEDELLFIAKHPDIAKKLFTMEP